MMSTRGDRTAYVKVGALATATVSATWAVAQKASQGQVGG
jgi:hypothetical protein